MQEAGILRLAGVATIGILLALGCSSHSDEDRDHPADTTNPIRSLQERQRIAGRCPDGAVPTLSASSIGLVASKSYGSAHGAKDDSSVADSRCLIDPISFAVPQTLPVVKGDAGQGRATLSFHDESNDVVVDCEYRGTSKKGARSTQTWKPNRMRPVWQVEAPANL